MFLKLNYDEICTIILWGLIKQTPFHINTFKAKLEDRFDNHTPSKAVTLRRFYNFALLY